MHLCTTRQSARAVITGFTCGKGSQAVLALLLCGAMVLSGCGPLPDFGGDNERPTANVSMGKPLVVPESNNESGNSSGTLVAPGVGTGSGMGASSLTMPNGLPALQPLKGVKVEKLFSENIRDTDQRFDRVENAVLDLRREFETVKPAIVRLVAVESDIQELISQLEMMLNNEPARAPTALSDPSTQDFPETAQQPPQPLSQPAQTPAAPVTAQPQVPTPPAAVSPPPASSGGVIARDLRVGVHDSYVRLVIDANRKTPYSYSLDNNENLLIIELPEAGWSGARQESLGRLPVVKSYTVQSSNDGKGSLIAIMLEKGSRVLKAQDLPPGSSNNPNFRIFIDLAK